LQVAKAEEQKRKAENQLNKIIINDRPVFVELKNKSLIGKMAKLICSILEWKWSLEKENNKRKIENELFNANIKLEKAKKKGLIK